MVEASRSSAIRQRVNPLVLAALGLGCLMAWEMIGYSPTLLEGIARAAAMHMDDVLWYEEAARIVFLTIVAAASFFHRGMVAYKGPFVACSVLVALGTAGIYVVAALDVVDPVLVATCEILMACKVVLAVFWGAALCRFNVKAVAQVLASANMLAVVIAFSNPLFPLVAQVGLHAALPLGASALFVRLGGCSRCETSPQPTRLRDARVPWSVLAGVGVLNAVLIVIKKMSETKVAMPDEASWLVADLFVCAALLLYTADCQRSLNVSTLVKWAFPLYAVSMIMVFTESGSQTPVEVYAIGCSWAYLYVLYWQSGVVRRRKRTFRLSACLPLARCC